MNTSVLIVWRDGRGRRLTHVFPIHSPEWRQAFQLLAQVPGAHPRLTYLHGDARPLAEVAA